MRRFDKEDLHKRVTVNFRKMEQDGVVCEVLEDIVCIDMDGDEQWYKNGSGYITHVFEKVNNYKRGIRVFSMA